MADAPQTLALIILGQKYRGQVVPQVNRRSAMLRILPFVKGTGQNAAWAVEGSGQLAANFAEGAAPSDFGSDEQKSAILGWARVWSPFHLTGTAQRAAKTAEAGPDGMRSLLGRNLVNSSAAVASKVNQQIFSGNGASSAITGFDEAIAKDDNTYASIDRASVSYWRPTVVDPGVPTKLTFSLLRSDLGAVYDACGETPDIAVCSTAIWNSIGGLFDSSVQYVKSVMTPRGEVVLDAGFKGIEIDGCVFIKDKDATANRLYYLNTNYMEMQYAALDPDVMAAAMSIGMQMGGNDGYGDTPLGIRCEKIAKLGDADRYICLTELNLAVRRPNAFGCRKNVQV